VVVTGDSEGAAAPHRIGRALFAASFDPLTNGHLDLIHRTQATFPELVVAVARNVAKQGTFSVDERLEILHTVLDDEPGIRITAFDGLLVDYAREIGARVLVRGLRAVSDFEYEFEMALMNKRMYPEIETVFMMTWGISSRRSSPASSRKNSAEAREPADPLRDQRLARHPDGRGDAPARTFASGRNRSVAA